MTLLTEEIFWVNGMSAQIFKEKILKKLREQGKRITRQRMIILDIILEESCSCCKEIYYKAVKVDASIGIATVYRMLNLMEEIGVIQKNSISKIAYQEYVGTKMDCIILLDDGTSFTISKEAFHTVLSVGLKSCGYMKNQKVKNISF